MGVYCMSKISVHSILTIQTVFVQIGENFRKKIGKTIIFVTKLNRFGPYLQKYLTYRFEIW